MATPLRKEIPSTKVLALRLTDYELASLEARAGARMGGGYEDGRAFAGYVRGLLGLPERARRRSSRAVKKARNRVRA